MSSMDNIDAGHLASLPADGTPARITLAEDAPRGTYEEGAESSIIIEASAENYRDLFAGLEVLNAERPRLQFTSQWVYSMVRPEQTTELLTAGETEDLLTSVVTTNHSPFLTYTAPVALEVRSDDARTVNIHLTVTAPSIYAGMQALKHLTTPRVLQSTAQGIGLAHHETAG